MTYKLIQDFPPGISKSTEKVKGNFNFKLMTKAHGNGNKKLDLMYVCFARFNERLVRFPLPENPLKSARLDQIDQDILALKFSDKEDEFHLLQSVRYYLANNYVPPEEYIMSNDDIFFRDLGL